MQLCKLIVLTTICAIGLTTSFGAQAEGRFTVALGASLASGFSEGADHEVGQFPYVSYENGRMQIGLDGVYFRFDATDAKCAVRECSWRRGLNFNMARSLRADAELLD